MKALRPPYNEKEVEFLSSIVLSGLKKLKDIGKGVNYEEMCMEIQSIPESLFAPEWRNYWLYWGEKFKGASNNQHRNSIFRDCIRDLHKKGLLPKSQEIVGLTGNYNARILKIIQKSEEEDKKILK